jgi:hypothetical protein
MSAQQEERLTGTGDVAMEAKEEEQSSIVVRKEEKENQE